MILDLYGCDTNTFNRDSISEWLRQLCELIGMQREDLHFWDYEEDIESKKQAPDHLAGTSAVQFITTSDIVIHTLDNVRECYINIFTCKDFDAKEAHAFTAKWFKSEKEDTTLIVRGKGTKAK